jgi:putative ABC transport system permease protein
VRTLTRRGRVERELDDEMRFHLEARADEMMRRGFSREEARRRARLEFGAVDKAKEATREARGVSWLEDLLQDVRFAVRVLVKAPGFAAVAIVTLAIGIGASTAIFSVVNGVLLHPLAYGDSDRLVTILHNGSDPVAVANYLDWRDQSRSFTAMGAADYWSANLTGVDSPEHILGLKVTQNLMPMLGVQPLMGRLFAKGEDEPGAEHEVILSYGLWQRRFGGVPDVVGSKIRLSGESYTVVGVMPASFHFAPFWATHAEMWVPNVLADRAHSRSGNSLRVFARLKPGVSLAQARAEIASIAAHLEQEFPGTNHDVEVTPLKEKVVGKIETPLLVLFCAVGFVLLIACANVAHMLLARAASRQKEIAVRTALGARRGRVVRQLLTENLLLAGAGGAAGLLFAIWSTHALVSLSPPDIPRVESVSVDMRAILFMLGVTLVTSIAFGLAPALQSSTVNLTDALKDGGRGTSEGAQRSLLRSVLIASEFALALILLIGAGLMIRSFVALESVDPGFNPHHVLSIIVSVAGTKESPPAARTAFYRELVERTRSLAGVESAAGINHLPLRGDMWGWSFQIAGRPSPKPGDEPIAVYRIATPSYFQTMQIPLLRGRDIAETDDGAAPGVVVINERAARDFWPGEDPIGQRVSFVKDTSGAPVWLTVIGIVKNVKQEDWAEAPYPEAYLAAFQNRDFLGDAASHSSYITLVVRTMGDPAAFAPTLKSAVWAFDNKLAISDVTTMDGEILQATAQARFVMLLLMMFAVMALLLAAVGIYGVMSYSVSRRTHEIGVRISLGASRVDVLRMVIRQGMMLALIGSAIGLVGALALARLMKELLYGVVPFDPITFISVAALLMAVALAASCIPARRAMRVDPMVALRHE